MDKLTSRIIREKLKETFDVDFTDHKAAIDKITMDVWFSSVITVKLFIDISLINKYIAVCRFAACFFVSLIVIEDN